MNSSVTSGFGILHGIKVLSTGSAIAAPFACGLMGEQGADVIHIESTLGPDVCRQLGDAWTMEHRNQRAITLNIPSPEGKEILTKLLQWSDILVESSKGGTWKKWGLTDETLWKINPKLVIVHVSGFGQTGEPDYVSRASYDAVGQAFSGFTAINGMADPNPPITVKPYICDYVTGLNATWTALAALLKARQTGVGESIDIAQYEVMARVQAYYAVDGFNKGQEIVRIGNADPVLASDMMYQCQDKYWVYLSFTGAAVLKRGAKVLGLEKDPDFAELPPTILRKDPRAEKFLNIIRKFCSEHSAMEVERIFSEVQVPCCKVRTHKELLEDRHVKARQSIVEWEDPEYGKMKGIGVVPKFTNNPGKVVRGSPTYGMDNEEVLQQFGYTEQSIATLYEKGVIRK